MLFILLRTVGHPGKNYNHKIRRYCDNYKCDDCVKHKLAGRGYGLLPEREVTAMPFQDLATDLIGPWVVPVGNKVLEFNALTYIDMCKNLVELVCIKNKSADHMSRLFAHTWLARYPRPDRCIHNNGGKFIGHEFQRMLRAHEIKDVTTTSKNRRQILYAKGCTKR